MGLCGPRLSSGVGSRAGDESKGEGRYDGKRSGVSCWTLRRLGRCWASWRLGKSSKVSSSDMGFRGLEGVWQRLRAGAVRSRRAVLTALGLDETRERGVKNLRNLRGVIEGLRRSLLPWLGGALGGEDKRLPLKVAEVLGAPEGSLSSAMVTGERVIPQHCRVGLLSRCIYYILVDTGRLVQRTHSGRLNGEATKTFAWLEDARRVGVDFGCPELSKEGWVCRWRETSTRCRTVQDQVDGEQTGWDWMLNRNLELNKENCTVRIGN